MKRFERASGANATTSNWVPTICCIGLRSSCETPSRLCPTCFSTETRTAANQSSMKPSPSSYQRAWPQQTALSVSTTSTGSWRIPFLAYIEETDLSVHQSRAYSRIKDWTTNDELWIRHMRTDAYQRPNTLHFIQTGNKITNIYLEPGDTRIVVIFVPDLEPGEEIPRTNSKQNSRTRPHTSCGR